MPKGVNPWSTTSKASIIQHNPNIYQQLSSPRRFVAHLSNTLPISFHTRPVQVVCNFTLRMDQRKISPRSLPLSPI